MRYSNNVKIFVLLIVIFATAVVTSFVGRIVNAEVKKATNWNGPNLSVFHSVESQKRAMKDLPEWKTQLMLWPTESEIRNHLAIATKEQEKECMKWIRQFLKDTYGGFAGYGGVQFVADGRRVVSVGYNQMSLLQYWDIQTGRLLSDVGNAEMAGVVACSRDSFAFSPDGSECVIGGRGVIWLWDLITGRQLKRLKSRSNECINTLAYSSQNILVALQDSIGTALWDTEREVEQSFLKVNANLVGKLTLSSDGQSLAWAHNSGKIILADVSTKAILGEFEGHPGEYINWADINLRPPISALVFNPDGKLLASSGIDKIFWGVGGTLIHRSIRLWDMTTKEMLWAQGSGYKIYDLAFSPDGELMASVSDWGLGLRNVKTGKKIASRKYKYCDSLAFNDDGTKLLVSGGADYVLDLAKLYGIGVIEPRGRQPITWGVVKENLLWQNFPNPFKLETWLPYQLADDTYVTISIYNAKGQLAHTIDLGKQFAGIYRSKNRAAYWNGKDNFGQSVASGLYFYTLQAGQYSVTRRMLIVK